MYIVMMTKEGYTKIVNLMIPGAQLNTCTIISNHPYRNHLIEEFSYTSSSRTSSVTQCGDEGNIMG